MNWSLENEFDDEDDLIDKVKSLGFTDEEIEAILSRFFLSVRLSYEDWKEFIIIDEEHEYDAHDDQYLKLPTGRVVLIPHDVYDYDIISNADL